MRSVPHFPTARRASGALLWSLLLAGGLIGCSETSPTLLVQVDDPEGIGPNQLRVSIAAPGDVALSITRPETAGARLPPGQTLRVLLPDAAVGGQVVLGVEALLDGDVRGRADGTFTPVGGEELVARLTLAPVEPDHCDAASCPEGCCQDGVCQTGTPQACGIAGGSCSACDATVADTCLQGGCRCGTNPACGPGYLCSEGACLPASPQTCTSNQDCAAYASPGQCFRPSSLCEGGVCVPNPKVSGTPCDDGDACNSTDVCDGTGRCVGTKLQCSTPPNTLCFEDARGVCVSGACQYQQLEEGAACSGTCVASGTCDADGTCVGDLNCPAPPNDQCYGPSTCTKEGGCVLTVLENGTACTDGRACTEGDSCQAGECVPGPNPCAGGPVETCCEQITTYVCDDNPSTSCLMDSLLPAGSP